MKEPDIPVGRVSGKRLPDLSSSSDSGGDEEPLISQASSARRGWASVAPHQVLPAPMSIGLVMYGADGRSEWANETAIRLLGPDSKSLIERNRRELESWKDSGLLAQAEQVRKNGRPRGGILTAADGSGASLEWRLERVELNGELRLLAVFVDVTEAQEAESALRQSRERYRDLVDNTTDWIFRLDRDGLITAANKSMAKILRLPINKLVGRRLDQVSFPVELSTQWLELQGRVLRSGRCAESRIVAVLSDKKPHVLEVMMRPIREPSGSRVGVRGLVRDVTERWEAEEALRQSEDQLRQGQKMEAIGRLAGGIAHDFNNLLTIIMGNTEMALGATESESSSRQMLEEALDAARRATGLTRQILAFSRHQVMEVKVLCLNDVVLGLAPLLARTLGEHLDLNFCLAPDLAQTEADPQQMEQVLMNLVVNARDAMPSGGYLTIETANVRFDRGYARIHPEVEPGRYVMLAVTDTGCGMDQKTQSQIFEPFFTTKEPGQGTGLGLSTVFGIVNQSEGSISVSSEVGQGTSFKVYLPQVHGVS